MKLNSLFEEGNVEDGQLKDWPKQHHGQLKDWPKQHHSQLSRLFFNSERNTQWFEESKLELNCQLKGHHKSHLKGHHRGHQKNHYKGHHKYHLQYHQKANRRRCH